MYRITVSVADLTIILIGLLLFVALIFWIIFRAQQNAKIWHNTLRKIPLGIILLNVSGSQLFENSIAKEVLQQLNKALISKIAQDTLQRKHVSSIVSGRGNSIIHVQGWLLEQQKTKILITLHDITEYRQREASQREFIKALSHELLTPLTAIQGHLAYIAGIENNDDSIWYGSLKIVQDEIGRLAWSLPNVLSFLQIDTGQPLKRRRSNLRTIAEESWEVLREKADQRGITIVMQGKEGELTHLNVDPGAWKQVFLNLLDNAIKYGNENGTITIAFEQTDPEQIVTVSNDGPGIALEDQPHLFEPLYRSEKHEERVAGSGLGLAIVRRIIEQHDGKIFCESDPSHGTTFHITLPRTNQNITIR